jgi:hypothetical protein
MKVMRKLDHYDLGARVTPGKNWARPDKVPLGTVGTVVEQHGKEYLRVKWDNGYEDGYLLTYVFEEGYVVYAADTLENVFKL